MRTFVAVPLPETFVRWLDNFKALNPLLNGCTRFVPSASCHMTIRFLGDVSDLSIQELSDRLSEALTEATATQIVLDTTGIFYHNGQPAVLWFGPRQVPRELLSAAEQVEKALVGFNCSARSERFTPHVTIGRFTHLCSQEAISRISECKIAPFVVSVREFVVFESILGQGQPVYVRRSQVKLRGLLNRETELY